MFLCWLFLFQSYSIGSKTFDSLYLYCLCLLLSVFQCLQKQIVILWFTWCLSWDQKFHFWQNHSYNWSQLVALLLRIGKLFLNALPRTECFQLRSATHPTHHRTILKNSHQGSKRLFLQFSKGANKSLGQDMLCLWWMLAVREIMYKIKPIPMQNT